MSQDTTKTQGGIAADADLVVPPLGTAADAAGASHAGPELRLSEVDRRNGLDRRQTSREEAGYAGPERRTKERRDTTGLERRRGAGIRRSDERRAAEEGEMNTEQFEFVMAVEAYKKVNKKLYPTWTEIFEVLRQLGYRKVHEREVKLDNVPEAPLDKAA
jgi:hypothetical protein